MSQFLLTTITLQHVSRQAVVLRSVLRGKTQGTRVTAAVAYVYPQKARPEPIAGTTYFEVIMWMYEIGAGASGSKSWDELM